jgi:hypothetical protein
MKRCNNGVLLVVLVVLVALSFRFYNGTTARQARQLARTAAFSMRCEACEASYTATLKELNALIRRGEYRDLMEVEDPEEPSRKFKCAACGMVESVVYEKL